MHVDCMMIFCKEQSINSVGIYKNIEVESEETIIERIQSEAQCPLWKDYQHLC